jgi:hypothetical protein
VHSDGVANGIHWDANAGHGDGLAGEARDRVVKFVGTGSTQGWENWLSSGVQRHVRDQGTWDKSKLGVVPEGNTDGRNKDESDTTGVKESRKDL